MTSDPNFALTFASDRVLVAGSGDLASSRGHYTLTDDGQGDEQAGDEQWHLSDGLPEAG